MASARPAPRDITTLIAPVPLAEPVVGDLRRQYDWAGRAGVPAHITLLGPFLPPAAVSGETLHRLRDFFTSEPALSFNLGELSRVGSVACLLPEPAAALGALTERLQGEWPQVPPYGSEHGGPLHHLTVARDCDHPRFERLSDQLRPLLPLSVSVTEVLLVERRDGAVRAVERFQLAG